MFSFHGRGTKDNLIKGNHSYDKKFYDRFVALVSFFENKIILHVNSFKR